MSDHVDGGLNEELRRTRPRPDFPEGEIRSRIRATLAEAAEDGPDSDAGGREPLPGSARRESGRLRSWGRAGLLLAASVALFVAGAEYGRRAGVPGAGEAGGASGAALGEGAAAPGAGLAIPLSIQAAGSEYVASLAGLSSRAEALTAEQRRLAEEVALTVLYAAVLELARAVENDRVLRSAADLVSARRRFLLESGEAPAAPEGGS